MRKRNALFLPLLLLFTLLLPACGPAEQAEHPYAAEGCTRITVTADYSAAGEDASLLDFLSLPVLYPPEGMDNLPLTNVVTEGSLVHYEYEVPKDQTDFRLLTPVVRLMQEVGSRTVPIQNRVPVEQDGFVIDEVDIRLNEGDPLLYRLTFTVSPGPSGLPASLDLILGGESYYGTGSSFNVWEGAEHLYGLYSFALPVDAAPTVAELQARLAAASLSYDSLFCCVFSEDIPLTLPDGLNIQLVDWPVLRSEAGGGDAAEPLFAPGTGKEVTVIVDLADSGLDPEEPFHWGPRAFADPEGAYPLELLSQQTVAGQFHYTFEAPPDATELYLWQPIVQTEAEGQTRQLTVKNGVPENGDHPFAVGTPEVKLRYGKLDFVRYSTEWSIIFPLTSEQQEFPRHLSLLAPDQAAFSSGVTVESSLDDLWPVHTFTCDGIESEAAAHALLEDCVLSYTTTLQYGFAQGVEITTDSNVVLHIID